MHIKKDSEISRYVLMVSIWKSARLTAIVIERYSDFGRRKFQA